MMKEREPQEPRISLQGMKVLQTFMDNASRSMSGSEIKEIVHLSTGTLYPILLRFEEVGWLESKWEEADPSKIRRPRKRFYRITSTGLSKASEVLNQFARETPAWT